MDEMTSVLDHPAISGAYFFPRPDAVPAPVRVDVVDAELACSVHLNDDPEALTLLHFHGNGETVADYLSEELSAFRNLGANVVYVEYRGYGASTGTPQLVAMLGDGEAVVRSLGLDFRRVVAFGRSIGSLYAIELAARHPELAGLVIESGIADPGERFLKYADLTGTGLTTAQVRGEVETHFDHARKLAAWSNPLLLLHTEHDGLIDISHAERNLAWAASPRKRLVRFPAGNHNTIMLVNHPEYFDVVREFLEGLS